MEEVLKAIEKYYQVNICLINPELNECRLTAKFDNQSLDFILDAIGLTFDIKIVKTAQGIELFGNAC